MSREILFRGKRYDGTDGNGYCPDGWVYGETIIKTDGYEKFDYMLPNGVSAEMYEESPYEFRANNCECRVMLAKIIHETVGQFTGLYDKKNERIFEGDIVLTQPCKDKPYSSKAKFKRHIGVVKYKIDKFNNKEAYYDAKWIVEVTNMGNFGCYDWSLFFDCEVIGNIHDNPELLQDDKNTI